MGGCCIGNNSMDYRCICRMGYLHCFWVDFVLVMSRWCIDVDVVWVYVLYGVDVVVVVISGI